MSEDSLKIWSRSPLGLKILKSESLFPGVGDNSHPDKLRIAEFFFDQKAEPSSLDRTYHPPAMFPTLINCFNLNQGEALSDLIMR
jgi:hypothetical protein